MKPSLLIAEREKERERVFDEERERERVKERYVRNEKRALIIMMRVYVLCWYIYICVYVYV